MDKEQALAVLKRGMSTEIWGQRFYAQAAARTEAEDGKRVFQSLIDEEGKHLDILRGQYAAMSGSQEWVSVEEARSMAAQADPTAIFPGADAAEQLFPADATDEQALQMAMDFEQRGYALYQQEAESASSPRAKEMWGYLARAEDQHFTFLQKTHEYLSTNGVWYFDDQEFPIFYD